MSTEPSARATQVTARSGAASSSSAATSAKTTGNKNEGASFLMALQSAAMAPEDASGLTLRADTPDADDRADADAPPPDWAALALLPADARHDALSAEALALGAAHDRAKEPSGALGPGAASGAAVGSAGAITERGGFGAGKPNLGKPGWTTLAAQRAAQSSGAEPRSSEAHKAPVLIDAAKTSGAAALTDGLLQGQQAMQAALGGIHMGPVAHGGPTTATASTNSAAGQAQSAVGTEGASDAPGAGLTVGTATRQRDASSYGGGRDHSAAAAGWQVDASGVSASGSTGTEAFGDALQHADVQQMAEQVSLWVASGVKEAELQIDQLGQEPVLVSISMDGARADVVFRSDEAGAREALSQSMAQLQALLQQEGLTLGSMSVGTQGRPSSDGAPNRGAGAALRLEKSGAGPQGLHPALDRAIDQALSASSGRPGGVDVFV